MYGILSWSHPFIVVLHISATVSKSLVFWKLFYWDENFYGSMDSLYYSGYPSILAIDWVEHILRFVRFYCNYNIFCFFYAIYLIHDIQCNSKGIFLRQWKENNASTNIHEKVIKWLWWSVTNFFYVSYCITNVYIEFIFFQ